MEDLGASGCPACRRGGVGLWVTQSRPLGEALCSRSLFEAQALYPRHEWIRRMRAWQQGLRDGGRGLQVQSPPKVRLGSFCREGGKLGSQACARTPGSGRLEGPGWAWEC